MSQTFNPVMVLDNYSLIEFFACLMLPHTNLFYHCILVLTIWYARMKQKFGLFNSYIYNKYLPFHFFTLINVGPVIVFILFLATPALVFCSTAIMTRENTASTSTTSIHITVLYADMIFIVGFLFTVAISFL